MEGHDPQMLLVTRIFICRLEMVLDMTICGFWVKSKTFPAIMTCNLNASYERMTNKSKNKDVWTLVEIY